MQESGRGLVEKELASLDAKKLQVGTGCSEDDTRGAEEALARYIAERYKPPGALPASELYIDEVVNGVPERVC